MPRSASPSRPRRCAREGLPPAVGSRVSNPKAKRHVAQPSPCGAAPGASCTSQQTHKEGHQLIHRDGGRHSQPAVGSLHQLRRHSSQSCVVAAAQRPHTDPTTAVRAQLRGRGAVAQPTPPGGRGWLATWWDERNTSSMRSNSPARGAWREAHGQAGAEHRQAVSAVTPIGGRTRRQVAHRAARRSCFPAGQACCVMPRSRCLRDVEAAATSHMRFWEGPQVSQFQRIFQPATPFAKSLMLASLSLRRRLLL